MKKNIKAVLLCMVVPLFFVSGATAQAVETVQNGINQTVAQSIPEQTSKNAQSQAVVEISNQTPPKLVAPVVENSKNQSSIKSHGSSKKIDLRAIIFDPNAQFDEEAKAEGREMTKLEEAEYNIHEALHCEVSSINKISRKGLLADKTTIKPERGPIASMTPWFNYKGGLSDNWAGENYKNTLFPTDSMTAGIDGKFRNKKTVFRVMANLGMNKEGHTFFNDVWGDNYIMHYFTPNDQVLVGYSRNAIGIEGGLSPFALPFYARSQVAKTYGNVRALGAKAQGQHKLYDYNLGMFSSGRNFMDWFPGPEFVGWLNVKPLGLTDGKYGALTLGGGLNAGNAESHYAVGSTYLEYEYKRWDLMCEYASADGSNGSSGFTSNQSEGYYGTLSYRITPKIQALIRYDKFDPNKNKMNDMRTEYTAGLNYYIKGQSLRLILNLVYYTVENGTYGTQIMTGAQIVL